MKNVVKVLSLFVKLGDKIVTVFGKAVDAVDHLVHYKEYRRERRIAAVFRTMLCVACGVLAVVFFPYKIKVEKNGDFEIRSLMLRVYRKTPEYEVPDGDGEFDICGVEDEGDECHALEAGNEA